jgi:hypothetical protein
VWIVKKREMVYGCDRKKFADRNTKKRGEREREREREREYVNIEIYGRCRLVCVLWQRAKQGSYNACTCQTVANIRCPD